MSSPSYKVEGAQHVSCEVKDILRNERGINNMLREWEGRTTFNMDILTEKSHPEVEWFRNCPTVEDLEVEPRRLVRNGQPGDPKYASAYLCPVCSGYESDPEIWMRLRHATISCPANALT